MGGRRDRHGAGALALRPPDRDDAVAGSGEVTAALAAPSFEIGRGVTGRRSVAQMETWAWEGPWSPGDFCAFGPRDTDLVE